MGMPAGFLLLILMSGCGNVDWYLRPRPDSSHVSDYSFKESQNPMPSVEPLRAAIIAGAVGYSVKEYAGNDAYLGLAVAASVESYSIY